ncbi:MAG: heme exporter protein CcmD [Rhodospirillales bacterium]|nr:MAG: heme exporter protein CcmD [Rhodospirillales bacterium]
MEMGGYGRFVWPAFAFTALVLAGLLVQSLRTLKSREAQLAFLRDAVERTRPTRGEAREA